ncbi:MAG: MFS transporter [Pseudomonadota bacterium]
MLGSFGSWVVPFQTGIFVDEFALTLSESGTLGTVEIGAMAVVMLICAPALRRWKRSRVATIGALMAASAQAATFWTGQYEALIGARLLTGVGCGLIYAAVLASTAAVSEPDRLMGFGQVLMNIAFALIFFVAPLIVAVWSGPAIFLAFALLTLALIPTFSALPLGKPSNEESSKVGDERTRITASPVAMHFFAVSLLNLGFGAAWGFAERAGTTIGLSPAAIGFLFSISTIAMIVGSLGVAIMGTRFGRAWPMLLAAIGCGVSGPLLMIGQDIVVYAAALMLFVTTNQFIAPYFMAGVSAQIESSGALSSMTGGVTFLTYSLGVGAGGYIIETASYAANGWFVFSVCVASGIVFFVNDKFIIKKAA